MTPPLQITDLPGSERARKFEGREHGATVSSFISRHAPGEGPGLHIHPYEETFIMLEGICIFTVDGESIEARAGEIVVVPKETPHGFKNSGDSRLLQVSIHPSDHVIQDWLEDD
jgi:quercetin dioxygenase-like cupin family protein